MHFSEDSQFGYKMDSEKTKPETDRLNDSYSAATPDRLFLCWNACRGLSNSDLADIGQRSRDSDRLRGLAFIAEVATR